MDIFELAGLGGGGGSRHEAADIAIAALSPFAAGRARPRFAVQRI